MAIGLDLGGISSAQSANEAAYFERIQGLLSSNRPADVFAEKIGERMLNSIIWQWFQRVDSASKLSAGTADAVTLRYPSAGLCFLDLTAITSFGAASGAALTSLSLDIDRDIVVTMAKNGDGQTAKAVSRIQGKMGSALEATLPQQVFSQSPAKLEWGSTSTLLGMANNGGVPLTRITSDNSASAIPALSLPQDVKDEFLDAVNAGLTVIAPQSEMTVLRFRGLGYIVEDSQTGSAAYIVSGGGLSGGLLLGSRADLETPGICQAPTPPAASASNAVSSDPADCASEKLNDLFNYLSTMAGGLPGALNGVLGLATLFTDTLNCLAAQGVNSAAGIFADILTVIVAVVLSAVATAIPIATAIAAFLGPLGIVASVISIGVELAIGETVDQYARKFINKFTGGCPVLPQP